MLKNAPVVAAAALVVAVCAIAVAGPAAIAATPNCLTKANRIVACTDKTKANTPTRPANIWPKQDLEVGLGVDRARRGPRLRKQKQ